MENFELLEKIMDVCAMLDADEFPELCAYLDSVTDEVRGVTEDAYELANRILLCDKPSLLPPFIRDFIVELFEDAFDAGNAEAMNDLGAQYYDGSRGFEQDFSKAVRCYELAAENGSRQAQENLGYCYYYGRNMPVDYEKAFHYFALGAFEGHLISLYKIGDMYAAGYYVQKNEKEAFLIYEHCIHSMTDAAAPIVAGPVFLRLARCYLDGKGTEKDAKSALICFQKAETFLYDMVKNGDTMYKKSLLAAIEGQAAARNVLLSRLSEKQWLDGKRD